jgi:predicted DsbA family dithiol-disulfide isomerase
LSQEESSVSEEQVAVPVSIFFDYICPFSYVASVRLERLGTRYPIAFHWRFIETQPNASRHGEPLPAPDQADQWAQTQQTLEAICRDEQIPLAAQRFTTNSRRALLLAQAVLNQCPERFMAFHAALFAAYFVEQRNIGDPEVLTAIARAHGVDALCERAWATPEYFEKLLEHVEAAQQLGVQSVPTLVLAERAFSGAAAVETLEQALAQQSEDDGPRRY